MVTPTLHSDAQNAWLMRPMSREDAMMYARDRGRPPEKMVGSVVTTTQVTSRSEHK
jgi:hypothetical protein